MHVIPSHGCMLYHVIVIPSFATTLNGIVVVIVVCLTTLQNSSFMASI